MTRRRKWQSGSADLVSVAVGMMILSIAVTGTSAAMIYGREILTRQEHYKAVAYLLRGKMEKKVWELSSMPLARQSQSLQGTAEVIELTLPNDRGPGSQVVDVTVEQNRIREIPNLSIHPTTPAYYELIMTASWVEPEMAEQGREHGQQEREIRFVTYVYNPQIF